jgi:hypothetical protein
MYACDFHIQFCIISYNITQFSCNVILCESCGLLVKQHIVGMSCTFYLCIVDSLQKYFYRLHASTLISKCDQYFIMSLVK